MITTHTGAILKFLVRQRGGLRMKYLNFLIMALMIVSVASATETVLNGDYISMETTDTEVVEYCIYEQGAPVDIEVVIDPICQELDNVLGCSGGDVWYPTDFSVTPVEPTTGPDGCVDLVLETTLGEEEVGTFVYTVNGYNGYTYVGAETGTVYVPEFTTVAAIAMVALLGIFVYRKRQN